MIGFMGKLFKKIGAFLKKLTGKAFKILRDNAGLAVAVTEKLKDIVESPILDFGVSLIPGDLDDKALAALRLVLPRVALRTAETFNILRGHEKDADAVAEIIAHLKQINPDARAAFWLVFSAELNKALADGEISLAEASALAQMVYIEKKGAKS